MVQRRPEQLTLREKCTEAERLTRELIDHLERGFLPKVEELQRMVADGSAAGAVQDVALRNSAARLLEGDAFTEQLFGQIQDYCTAIDRAVAEIVGET